MLALACAGLFAITAGAAPAGVTATPKVAPLSPTPGAYLTFSSATAFTIKPQQESWNGTLYWSTDTTFWSVFTASGATAAPDNGAGEYKLHLCGSGNTYITGSSTSSPWLITAGNPVDCSGNIETLLDHATVADGEHPTMASCCFAYLFRDCAALASTPSLPATNLANHCYYNLFNGCTSLTSAPALPATILPERCYNGMFNGCTSLAQAPVLRATNLAESCYGYMFYKCSGLTSAPALPATNLADYCYNRMFYDCTGLTTAPTLPATTLAERCYEYMFRSCTKLTQAPALPATNLADYCYANMFNRCTGLTRAPALPATNLAERCYNGMFTSCTGLTNTPALPATTLAPDCYSYMFQSCTGLTRLPDLPATNLTDSCYRYMFYKCTGIELNTEGPGMPWSIPNNAIEATDWNLSMFADTSGTFKGAPVIGTTYYLASGAPDAPTFATDGTGFVIGDNATTIKIVNAESGIWYTVYKVDDLTQTNWTKIGDSIKATGSDVIFTIPRDPTVPRRFFKVVASFTAP
ncbi:MAG: leucine-rich repeat protein [Kiritimatiellae bacterium]|nr:leucine-rich repeat protein [Kiritimatiellia bacterium]